MKTLWFNLKRMPFNLVENRLGCNETFININDNGATKLHTSTRGVSDL